jgi:hypothetical protein
MNTRAVLPYVLAVATLLMACGGGGKSAAKVAVSLKEWQVDVQPAEVKPGNVELTVTNNGSQRHQLVLVKSDLPPGQLPTSANNTADESKLNIADRVADIDPGATAKLELELFPGKYVLICNLISSNATGPANPHYLNGMAAGFFVLDE